MQLSNAPNKILLPFANSGTKNTIPVPSQISVTPGAASYTDGFPPLTFTPVASGGVPPYGADFNGVLNAITSINRWVSAGAGYVYDSSFATDSNVGGYPKGARVLRTDGQGYWLNIADNNTTNPESGGSNWVPDYTYGVQTITMTNANVTLTPLQYGKPMIKITGTLAANVQLIFPDNIAGEWTIYNNATLGAFTITAKTVSGSGVNVGSGVNTVVSDGIDIFNPSIQTQQTSISGSYKNLKTDSIGVNNYNCVITADEVILKNTSGASYLATSVNKTVNANGTVGAPLSIMSSRVASTWYYRWLWYNSTNGLTATLDVSSSSPTAPTGYASSDYKALLPGADRTDASGSTYLLQIITRGRKSAYVPLVGSNMTKLPTMVSGVQGSQPSTFVSVAVAGYVPSTASSIKFFGADTQAAAGLVIVAPNDTYRYQGGATITGNPSPYQFNGSGTSAIATAPGEFILESSNIYVIMNAATCVVNCIGWEDNI